MQNFIEGIDWALLRSQKAWLLEQPSSQHCDGLVNFINRLQSAAVESGIEYETVFDNLARVRKIAEQSAIYVPPSGEAIRITYCEDTQFFGDGEDTGQSYSVEYSQVDLSKCKFLAFFEVNPDRVV